jgi:hypothetical protein
MTSENMKAEIAAMIEVAIYNFISTPWYVHLAKIAHLVFFVVGTLIAISISSYLLGWIVIAVTIAYVIFWAAWLGKRIERKV